MDEVTNNGDQTSRSGAFEPISEAVVVTVTNKMSGETDPEFGSSYDGSQESKSGDEREEESKSQNEEEERQSNSSVESSEPAP